MLYNFSSEEEYFKFEEAAETRNEVIDGFLFRQADVTRYHQDTASNIFVILNKFLNQTKFDFFSLGFKVKTPNGNFFYPDVIVCSKMLKNILQQIQFCSLKFYQKQPANLI